ncbi:MAG: hypothetical protein KME01_09060 [Chroococcus sp. CMT-3BRIN-NPC107]|jgi:hypothetical protein|nr:hypothetical protein [Chroococcus sp. CMT-3BRIN-NPC107]
MQQTVAIAPFIEAPQTQLTNKNPSSHYLVAVWRLDENSKLYCQWIEQKFNK